MIDRADVLDAATERGLVQELLEYERTRGHQVVVHTTPSLEGLTIEDYSIAIADAWRVGHAGIDNGVILTVAPNERKVRIEVGYGLEGVLPDAIASRIVRDTILPEFRRGDLAGGTLAGVRRILAIASGEVAPPGPDRRRQNRPEDSTALVLFWILIIVIAFGSRGWAFWPFILGRSGRTIGRGSFGGSGWGGSRGGGGGFSGGGGGFGGGGASGSW